jgi:hypothetical protein
MSTITFGVSDYSGLSLFLDDISVVDSVNPFVELLSHFLALKILQPH